MIKYLKEVNSTSTYIKEHLNELNNFDIVSAEHQTGGKGRTGHNWEDTDNENVLMSILIKDSNIVESFNILSIGLGVIVYKYLTNYLPPKSISLKWPNDVYVNDKKICGILLEGKLPEYVIIGIGLNINQKTFSIDNATSLSLETEYEFKIDNIRELFFEHLTKELSNYNKNKERYLDAFNRSNYLKNREINYFDTKTNSEQHGIALDINDKGELMVNHDGEIISISSSEVSKIR